MKWINRCNHHSIRTHPQTREECGRYEFLICSLKFNFSSRVTLYIITLSCREITWSQWFGFLWTTEGPSTVTFQLFLKHIYIFVGTASMVIVGILFQSIIKVQIKQVIQKDIKEQWTQNRDLSDSPINRGSITVRAHNYIPLAWGIQSNALERSMLIIPTFWLSSWAFRQYSVRLRIKCWQLDPLR